MHILVVLANNMMHVTVCTISFPLPMFIQKPVHLSSGTLVTASPTLDL